MDVCWERESWLVSFIAPHCLQSRIFDSIETTVSPPDATTCPERFVFVATIKTSAPVNVTYRWDRCDHAIGPIETASWLEAGVHEASTYWLIGSSTGGPVTFDGWDSTIELRWRQKAVESPVSIGSTGATRSYCSASRRRRRRSRSAVLSVRASAAS